MSGGGEVTTETAEGIENGKGVEVEVDGTRWPAQSRQNESISSNTSHM